MELYLEEGQLVDEEKWKQLISEMRTDFDTLNKDKNISIKNLKKEIERSIKDRSPKEKFGILLSGGVDSSLLAFLCKQYGSDFCCYSVGIENSQDIDAAISVSKKYNFELKHKILTLEEYEGLIKETISILKKNDIVWVSVGAVTLAASKLAKEDGINILFSGLGTEELFAGYQRHDELASKSLESLHTGCWAGLETMWQRDFLRDRKILDFLDMELRTPYLDKKFIKESMSIHPELKIDEIHKKKILRELAEDLGLGEEFAWRKKKAAQYGSNFIRGLDKLTKKSGFSTKREYIESILKDG